MSPPNSTAAKIKHLLNDNVLGFLALMSLFLGLAEAIFPTASGNHPYLTGLEMAILVIFSIEYFAGLYDATDRRAFIVNPWRLLDAMIIGAGVLSLLPAVSNLLSNTPALRLIRFARLALFGTRSGGAMMAPKSMTGTTPVVPTAPFEALALITEPAARFTTVTWEDVLTRINAASDDWLMTTNIASDKMGRLAQALGVPEASLRTRFYNSQFPRIERMENYTTVFLWYPTLLDTDDNDIPTVRRTAVLLVGSTHNVVTLTGEPTELPQSILQRIPDADTAEPLLVRTTSTLLKIILRRYTRICDRLETTLIRIESQQKSDSDNTFLDRTFRLRAEISRIRGSLKHLAQVLRQLAEQSVAIKGFESTPRPAFSVLADDAEALYDGVDDLMATLTALVDMRLNISSFQMNKVMRLLAILTALTVIPAVTGGLLGMNLSDNPWPLTLAQVSFGVAVGTTSCLYVFAVKGWLR